MTLDPATLRLIAIAGSLRDGVEGLVSRAQRAVLGGTTMIQLRLPDESPRTIVDVARALLSAVDVPVLVNGRADVAMAAGAHGVHLSIDDLSPAVLRRIVPDGFVIGVSLGDETGVGRTAGADYVGIGPVFGVDGGTGSGTIGLGRFSTLTQMCALPAVAIGGVSAANVGDVMRLRAAGVAVISAVFAAADPMVGARAIRAAQDASGS